MEWLDGLRVYTWHGARVGADLIENRSAITWQEIHRERNSEVRRIKLSYYGEANYLQDSAAIVVEENELGTLYQLDIPDDEPLMMVRVRNSTPEPDGSYNIYFLRVPPSMQRVKQAIAWTFGLEEHEYEPCIQT